MAGPGISVLLKTRKQFAKVCFLELLLGQGRECAHRLQNGAAKGAVVIFGLGSLEQELVAEVDKRDILR